MAKNQPQRKRLSQWVQIKVDPALSSNHQRQSPLVLRAAVVEMGIHERTKGMQTRTLNDHPGLPKGLLQALIEDADAKK